MIHKLSCIPSSHWRGALAAAENERFFKAELEGVRGGVEGEGMGG